MDKSIEKEKTIIQKLRLVMMALAWSKIHSTNVYNWDSQKGTMIEKELDVLESE